MKDYLVILAGLPRGGSKSWKSLKKNVIQDLDADLAICTEDNIDKVTEFLSEVVTRGESNIRMHLLVS